MLNIQNLTAKINGKTILNDLSLSIPQGSLNILMGPNGSGKSTLAQTIMGFEHIKVVTKKTTKIEYLNNDLSKLKTFERSHLGIFLSFQDPIEIEGLSTLTYLKEIRELHNASPLSFSEFKNLLNNLAQKINFDPKLFDRDLNLGFSGGEKKKLEIIQVLLTNPILIIFDEIDSGLDIDSLKLVAKEIKNLQKNNKTILLISHQTKMIQYLKPDKIHLISKGQIIRQGDISLLQEIEKKGLSLCL